MSCACALGRDNAEVLANLRARVAPGMREIAGDIPNRPIWFGAVPGELPVITDPEFDFRSCRLLEHAVCNMAAELKNLVARYGADRIAIVLGASNTGIDEAQTHVDTWLDAGAKPEKMRFSMIELGTPADYLARRLGVTGPAYVVSTACSSAAKAFAAARRLLDAGLCDAAITGGTDARCRFAMNGFHALGALAAGRTRPLADDRDGINLGEGVALFTLERGSAGPVLYLGAGETSDAYHATAPDPSGAGSADAMRGALADAGLEPADVAYVNLHGTGTVANDAMEMKALRDVFGETLPVYESTKDLTGHCLGAAGAVEAALVWLKTASGDLKGPSLSNSFAFGGSNACVAFGPAR